MSHTVKKTYVVTEKSISKLEELWVDLFLCSKKYLKLPVLPFEQKDEYCNRYE